MLAPVPFSGRRGTFWPAFPGFAGELAISPPVSEGGTVLHPVGRSNAQAPGVGLTCD
jgi:hypothetical protein